MIISNGQRSLWIAQQTLFSRFNDDVWLGIVLWTLKFVWSEHCWLSKDCQNSAWQAIILDLDYSLVVLCVTSFCLILRDLVKRKWRFVNSDLTTDEIIPYLHQRKFGKFIDSFLDWSGTLEFSELSNEQIDWGYCLCWWLLLDIGGLLVFSLFMRVVGREATTRTSQNIYYECSSLSDLQHLSVKVSKMANPFYQNC